MIRAISTDDDVEMKIRLITPRDGPKYRDLLEQMTEQERYHRFFRFVKSFDLNSVRDFVDFGSDTLGFISEEGPQLLGAAHAFIEGPVAEVAIIVASDARHQHVGQALMLHIINALQVRECDTVTAFSLSDNVPFARLAKSVGMARDGISSGVTTWTRRGSRLPSGPTSLYL
jgi:ribosomal protein S18 acetylase RimI-like enzyme